MNLKKLFLNKCYLVTWLSLVLCTTAVIKGKLDTNEYKTETFKNGIVSLMVIDDKTEKSACGLSVKINHLDKAQIEMIAPIFYLLSMYENDNPDICNFENFLLKYNGNFSILFNDEVVWCHFDAETKDFVTALERFSTFFCSPSFTEEKITKVLDSISKQFEFEKSTDFACIKNFEKHCTNESFKKIFYRNEKTSFIDEKTGKRKPIHEIKEMLDKFKNIFLDPKLFKLILVHNENILEEAKKLFGSIESLKIEPTSMTNPNNYQANTIIENNEETFHSLEYTEFNKDTDMGVFIPKLYSPDFTNKIIYLEQIEDKPHLRIYIEIPDQKKLYKRNMLEFLRINLLNEYEGSLIAKYRTSLLAYDVIIHIEPFLSFSKLIIEIYLLDKGLADVNEVLNIFYNHLNNLETEKSDYDLLKLKEDNDFKYMEKLSPYDLANKLAHAMQLYPIENIYNYRYVYKDYNESEFNYILDVLKNSKNWLIFVVSKKEFEKYKEECVEIENYGIRYAVSNSYVYSDPKMLNSLTSTSESTPNIQICGLLFENLSKADNKELIKSKLKTYFYKYFTTRKNVDYEKELTPFENKVETLHDFSKFAFINDSELKSNNTYISIKLNKEINRDNYCKVYFYLKLLNEEIALKLEKERYFKRLNIRWDLSEDGIEFIFSGDTKNITWLILEVFELLKQTDTAMFEYVKILITKEIKEMIDTPTYDIVGTLKSEILDYVPTTGERLEQFKNMKVENLKLDFSFYLEMFVCSNSDEAPFRKLYDYLRNELLLSNKFNYQYLLPDKKIERNDVKSFSTVAIYYRNEKFSYDESKAIINVINNYLKEEIHNCLLKNTENSIIRKFKRFFNIKCLTEPQVEAGEEQINVENFIYFAICSAKTNDSKILKKLLKKLIKNIMKKIKNMSENCLNDLKEKANAICNKKFNNLEEYFNLNLHLFKNDVLDLKFTEKLEKNIKNISKDDILNFFSEDITIIINGKDNNVKN